MEISSMMSTLAFCHLSRAFRPEWDCSFLKSTSAFSVVFRQTVKADYGDTGHLDTHL